MTPNFNNTVTSSSHCNGYFFHCNCSQMFVGPYSEARPDLQPIDGEAYKVSYVPVETGIYSVYVKWNDVDVKGQFYQ